MKRNTNIKNQRLAYNLITTFLLVIATCIFIKYAHRYGPIRIISSIAFFIFLSLFIGCINISKFKSNNRKIEVVDYLIRFTLFLFLTWLTLFILKPNYDAWQLKKHGVQVLGKIKRHDERRGKGTRINLSVFEYEYNKLTYTQQINDPKEYYLLDDEIILNISKKDPEIFEILGKSYGEVK